MRPGYACARHDPVGRCHTHRVPGPSRPTPDGDAAALLATATNRAGTRPLAWLADPLRTADRVLELACGPGLLAGELGAQRWLGLDLDPGPARSGPFLRADPRAVPLRANAVDALALVLALPDLPDLDVVFAEVRRVLRPGGTLLVAVPSATPGSLAELATARALRPVHAGWRHRSALDRAGWLLAAADFSVMGDERVPFALPLPDSAAALTLAEQLPAARLWPPDLAEPTRAAAAAWLARRSGPGRVLPIPLRRLVARR
jgi:SAM-dependent methyltransferase